MQKQEMKHFNFVIFSKKAEEFLTSLLDDLILKLILTFLTINYLTNQKSIACQCKLFSYQTDICHFVSGY